MSGLSATRVEHPLAPADCWDDSDPTDCLTLGEVIRALGRLPPSAVLLNGFRSPHSYRGYYDMLAFEPADGVTAGEALIAAKAALGTAYDGYKGGTYVMHERTPCWIASYSECGHPLRGLALREGDGTIGWHGERAETALARVTAERDTATTALSLIALALGLPSRATATEVHAAAVAARESTSTPSER